ncbi:uncharacterized protein N7469_006827 [Penicillium citrinum]|uniref:DUF1993 domain-containing protein n=2 Tax=Penicillium TaxID=5073 RepID=A0A9W9TL50_PENCI|nr:uncharacterized protein N7469_006827 [Penicillium citrinum]KAJ5226821.1 hypothetical protein N7469_006827 [Penicillium citrinum]KAJ5568721.1 hypothetical protein N7450_011207 [Penicillium hetheringtonii]KAK5791117.1 hypothetical protein VI817_006426 [Penicillium citrinum]
MSHTFYDGTIVVLQGILETFSHILHKAEESPNSSAFPAARLHEDMYPLTDQIRLATQFSEYILAKVTGREPRKFEGNPLTFAEFYERIDTMLKSLKEADKDVVNANADKEELTQVGPTAKIELSNAIYAHRIALPNIYFHLNIAYGILRKEGVPLGKLDYFAGFFPPSMAQGK